MRPFLNRSRSVAALFFAATALLLAACAPAVGGQSTVPVRAGASAIPAKVGQTLYVRVDYSLGDFRIDESDLKATMWVPSGYNSEVGDVSMYFGLRDVQGASGWQIGLSRMRLQRTTVTSQSFGTTSVLRDLWAEVKVVVPDDAIPGVYRVRGTIEARGGTTQPVTFRIDVSN
jgi:hypothetical protein